ncbi:MAG TPA: hypothetical protein VID94_18505 [Acidimicrobiales bacterium]|jgi:hypothetical protein
MTPRTVVRIALAILAVVGLQVGLWAAFAPQSFYDDFPGAGRIWVGVDGPYNQHLVRDVGALNLALAVVAIVAFVTLSRAAVLAAGGAWLAYGVPHLIYHLRHLDPLDGADQVAVPVSLFLSVVLAAMVLWTGWRNPGETLS